MRAAALVALILALAGPRWPDLRTRLPTEGIAIVILVDVSGSMGEVDFPWFDKPVSRLEAVKKVFRLFVAGGEGPDGELFAGRPDDLIGLATFATRPNSPCPLTLSHSVMLRMLDGEKPRTLPTESQTNIGDAIAWGLHRLESAGARRKVLILLSDGEHNVPPPALKPRQAAQLAASLRVPIYCINAAGDMEGREARGEGRGSEDEVFPRPSRLAPHASPAGENTLQAVAQVTGGRSFRAQDGRSLLTVCQEIDRLERGSIESFQYRRYYEAYPWCGLAAVVLLIVVFTLEMTWWQRVP
jgi:Ca-activated chloride channel family protein